MKLFCPIFRNTVYCAILSFGCLSAYENLLHDDEEIEEYVANFPYENYEIYDVPGQGKFYLEPELFDTVKNVLRRGQQWESYNLHYINKYALEGTVVLNIGAHIGSFTIPLSKTVGDDGIVYAFEPQKKIYRELRKNCELNEVTNALCYRLAIGDKQQIIERDKETYPGSEGSTGIGAGGDLAQMITIDSLELENISFVLIDVERSEEQVIDGMIETLIRNKPAMVVELQGGYILETAPEEIKQKIMNTINKLTGLGYNVYRICNHDYLFLDPDKHQ